MKHSEIRARLSEYLERDLDPEERSRVDSHLESCASCASDLRELRATVSLLRRLPEPGHPDGLADAVMARVAQGARAPAPVHTLLRRVSEPRFAAALAAGIAGFALLWSSGDRNLPTQPLAAESLGTVASTTGLGQTRIAAAETRGSARAGVVSRATPQGAYPASTLASRTPLAHERRAKLEELARQLRGAGHPFSESVAAHFEAQPSFALADWQPR